VTPTFNRAQLRGKDSLERAADLILRHADCLTDVRLGGPLLKGDAHLTPLHREGVYERRSHVFSRPLLTSPVGLGLGFNGCLDCALHGRNTLGPNAQLTKGLLRPWEVVRHGRKPSRSCGRQLVASRGDSLVSSIGFLQALLPPAWFPDVHAYSATHTEAFVERLKLGIA
jgi:hypothetical protein